MSSDQSIAPRTAREDRRSRPYRTSMLACCLICVASMAAAQLEVTSEFNPSMAGTLCSIAVDQTTGDLWTYQCSDSVVQSYSSTGTFLSFITSPGELANDVDVDFSLGTLSLDGTALPDGTLLFINGETDTADVYAVNKTTGDVVATLTTDFGVSHVVGGAHHSGRGSIFLVQDRVPGSADENRIAEVDPNTGAVLNEVAIGSVFDVNYGDLDVCPATGHLFVVSNAESRIAELEPDGSLVDYYDLPVGVSGLAGIAIGTTASDVWVTGSGIVWRLSGFPCASIFADGFESGDTSRWSSAAP